MTMSTFADFARDHAITMTTPERVATNPNMPDFDGDNWKVTLLRRTGAGKVRQFTLHFSKGYGHKGAEPTLEEVLENLHCEFSAPLDGTFEDFCSDYGYDTDSRKAYATWQAIGRQNAKLAQFLGEHADDFQALEA